MLNSPAVVIYSGGMDSFTVLHRVLETRDRRHVFPITFDYGQRHRKEINYAIAVCKDLGMPHRIVDLRGVGAALLQGSALTSLHIPVPEGHYQAESMRKTVVPGRNAIMLSIAAGYAESLLTQHYTTEVIAALFYGAHSGDHHIYPDCRPKFVAQMGDAIWSSSDGSVMLEVPYLHGDKVTILEDGFRMGLDYGKTWTCLAKGTQILTLAGPEAIEAVRVGRWVWGFDEGEARWVPTIVENTMFQGIKEVYEVTLHDGAGHRSSFECTGDHRLMLRQGGYARLDELSRGARLMPSRPYAMKMGKSVPQYIGMRPHNDWREPMLYMHRYVAEFFGIGSGLIHHKDGNGLNNDPSNLEAMDWGAHTRFHTDRARDRIWNTDINANRSEKVKAHWAGMSEEEREARQVAIREGRSSQNHIIDKITKVGEKPTFDIQTGTQNFALRAGVFVHNCYKGESKPCGKCGACQERALAFEAIGKTDPGAV